MNTEATSAVLRARIVALEERQDDEVEGSPEWDSLESEQCDVETALIRLERGIVLGRYQSVINSIEEQT